MKRTSATSRLFFPLVVICLLGSFVFQPAVALATNTLTTPFNAAKVLASESGFSYFITARDVNSSKNGFQLFDNRCAENNLDDDGMDMRYDFVPTAFITHSKSSEILFSKNEFSSASKSAPGGLLYLRYCSLKIPFYS